jgi:cyclase
MADRARAATAHSPVAWARAVESAGAGEILLQCADRDGAGGGYDLELIDAVASSVKLPVIALGGAGEWSHMADVLARTRADAVAAANIFQYYDQSFYLAKKHLFDRGLPVRPPDLLLVD